MMITSDSIAEVTCSLKELCDKVGVCPERLNVLPEERQGMEPLHCGINLLKFYL